MVSEIEITVDTPAEFAGVEPTNPSLITLNQSQITVADHLDTESPSRFATEQYGSLNAAQSQLSLAGSHNLTDDLFADDETNFEGEVALDFISDTIETDFLSGDDRLELA